MKAHVRLSTRLTIQTAFTNTAEAGGLKDLALMNSSGLGVVVVEFEDPGSCWDIWERSDWVMALGSFCRLGKLEEINWATVDAKRPV